MRCLVSLTLRCDECPNALVMLAPPGTMDGPDQRAWLEKALEEAAAVARWSMEGPSLLAGDYCPSCHRRVMGGPYRYEREGRHEH